VPDVVMINTFPRMKHIVEHMELTGEHRLLIVADLHLGTPSDTGTCGTGRPSPAPRPGIAGRRRPPRRSGNSRVTSGPRY